MMFLPPARQRGDAKQVDALAVQPFPDILGNRHRLQRARIACLLRPDAGFAALGRDLARLVAEDVGDGEGAAAEPRDVAFDDKFLAGLRGALEGAFGGDQRRALRPLPAARVVVRDAGRRRTAGGSPGRTSGNRTGSRRCRRDRSRPIRRSPRDGYSAAWRSAGEAAAMAARVLDSASPSGSARAATRALATASAAARGVMRRARAGSITSAVMRR